MNNSSNLHSTSQRSQSMKQKKKPNYKIILLGDSATGKTSVITRFINNTFQSNQNPTIGIDFLVKNMNYKGMSIRLQLWDTAGQEKFKSLVPSYLKDATAVILVFDQSRPQTLTNLQDWVSVYRDNNHAQGGIKSMIGVLCGNKSDLKPTNLDKAQLHKIMDRYKFPYQSVSALSGTNIEQLFHMTLQAIESKQESQNQRRSRKQVMRRVEEQEGEPETETRLSNIKHKNQSSNKEQQNNKSSRLQLKKQNQEHITNCNC